MIGGIPPIRSPFLTAAGKVAPEWEVFFTFLGQQTTTGASAVRFGSHAQRLRLDIGKLPDGALFAESDRTSLYELRAGAWVWTGGEMCGTAPTAPDQRPTDLGANDAGFLFKSTNLITRYRWDGSAWVPLREMGSEFFSQHVNRLTRTPADHAIGVLFYEIDRGNVCYRNTGAAWVYVSGTYRNTLASIPVGLTADDEGFQFEATDFRHVFRWTGEGWERAAEDQPSGVIEMRLQHPWSHRGTVDVEADGVTVTWKTGQKWSIGIGTQRIRIAGLWYVGTPSSATQITLTGAAPPAAGVAYQIAVGWHFCDGNGDDGGVGTPVVWTYPDGTTTSTVIPNLTAGAYLKAGAAYGGAINPSVAPAVIVNAAGGSVTAGTGTTTAAPAGHAHGATVTMGSDPVPNIVMLPWFRK